MTRFQLEHIIRAAAAIAEDDDIVVIGSQAILGSHPDAPTTLLVSMEADVYPRKHPERSDLIDGSIGEDSAFHQTFGYYAQGVGPETAILPDGWDSRLVPIRNANTRGATGWTLEPHDLALSKYVAMREKDAAYLQEAVTRGLLDATTLRRRLLVTPVNAATRERISQNITAHFNQTRGA